MSIERDIESFYENKATEYYDVENKNQIYNNFNEHIINDITCKYTKNMYRLYKASSDKSIGGADLSELKETLKNDISIWSIVSALLMTIGFGAISVGRSSPYHANSSFTNDVSSTIFVFGMIMSSWCFLTSILFGSNLYFFYSSTPSGLVSNALKFRYSNQSGDSYSHFIDWLFLGVALLFMGMSAEICFLYGIRTFYVTCIPSFILVIHTFIRNKYVLDQGKNFHRNLSIELEKLNDTNINSLMKANKNTD